MWSWCWEKISLPARKANSTWRLDAARCTGARLFLTKNHFHVDSPLLRKTGESTYYAEEAKVTTCDADRPVWSFSARKLSVVTEGYATGRDGSFQLAGIPVLYLPLAVLPVMTSRQSGFLIPTYGQHRAGGAVVEAPFFWAINNYSDLTLYQTVFSNRGYMQGGEYRRLGHDEAAAYLRFFYINDSYAPAHEGTTNRRYWASGMINQPAGRLGGPGHPGSGQRFRLSGRLQFRLHGPQ